MREILFRGKNSKGEFKYGSFISNSIDNPCIVDYDAEQHEIYLHTLGQFTGLTDKNGVKIFEGDILNIFWGVGLGDTAEKVTYCEKYGYYKYGNNPICEILEDEKVSYLVIGNMHDK